MNNNFTSLSSDKKVFNLDDYLWLSTATNRWLLMPDKFEKIQKIGKIHLYYAWDQEFHVYKFPKSAFPDTEAVFTFLKESCGYYGRNLDSNYLKTEWDSWASSFNQDNNQNFIMLDISELMKYGSCHYEFWEFNGVILDRYTEDGIIDAAYYYTIFYSKKTFPIFYNFIQEITLLGLHKRDALYRLFVPSENTTVCLRTVFIFDGNSQRYLVEDKDDFLIYAFCGS